MAPPTISATGLASGLLKVTDQNGLVYRIPKGALSDAVDSSNAHSWRIELVTANNGAVLLFETEAAKDTFIANLEALY